MFVREIRAQKVITDLISPSHTRVCVCVFEPEAPFKRIPVMLLPFDRVWGNSILLDLIIILQSVST